MAQEGTQERWDQVGREGYGMKKAWKAMNRLLKHWCDGEALEGKTADELLRYFAERPQIESYCPEKKEVICAFREAYYRALNAAGLH